MQASYCLEFQVLGKRLDGFLLRELVSCFVIVNQRYGTKH